MRHNHEEEARLACVCELCVNKEYRPDAVKKGSLKVRNFDKWYDHHGNEDVIDYCEGNGIEPDDHSLIMEVKRRILRIDFKPEVILNATYWSEVRHNNWFLGDVPKELVASNSFPIREGRAAFPYMDSSDKIVRRIEHIAKNRINQTSEGCNPFMDMSWDTRRMRLCYYYKRWLGIKTYHPEMFDTPYTLCLTRLARVMGLAMEVRLFSLQKDIEWLEEMRGDIYKMFLIRNKNWGQKDKLANYYNCAHGYLRQMYLESRILIREYGDAARKVVPKRFMWVWLQQTRPGYLFSNRKLNRKVVPEWINLHHWSHVSAARNKDVNLEEIMVGLKDDEAEKIWVKDPYFMDPQALYDNRNEPPRDARRDFNRRIRKVMYASWKERIVPFSEYSGPLQDIGNDFPRRSLRFFRPYSDWRKVARKKANSICSTTSSSTFKSTANSACSSVSSTTAGSTSRLASSTTAKSTSCCASSSAANIPLDKFSAVKSWLDKTFLDKNETRDLNLAYTNLTSSHNLDVGVEVPIKDVNGDTYWRRIHKDECGPPEASPVVRYTDPQPGGGKRRTVIVNTKAVKKLLMDKENVEKVNKVRDYMDMLDAYRKARGTNFYDDMVMMFGNCPLPESHHLLENENNVFDFLAASPNIDVSTVLKGNLASMRLLEQSFKAKNPTVVYGCYNYYYCITKKIMSDSDLVEKLAVEDDDLCYMNRMWSVGENLRREADDFKKEMTDAPAVVTAQFIDKLKATNDGVPTTVLEFPLE